VTKARNWNRWILECAGAITLIFSLTAQARGESKSGADQFKKNIQPVLQEFCYDCHGDGEKKGNVTLDRFESDAALLENHELWWKVLKNVRAGLMPPPKKAHPSEAEKERVVQWIKDSVFLADPNDPDPGRVTLRRLNRVEYKNTVRDLLGVDFETDKAFPPDDSGMALTISATC